ncbi:MAG: alternative ribosome rescue aminoacyl-tRNA hydrolase ArfB [Anaerolineales bacterium]
MAKIPENELSFTFIRADGPGGQNANKVSSAVQLRFDVAASPSLSEEVKARLIKLAGKRITQDGILVIEAKRYRSQEKNRADAIARFRTLIEKALIPLKSRKKTRPTKTSQERRLKAKKRRSEIKRARSEKAFPDE